MNSLFAVIVIVWGFVLIGGAVYTSHILSGAKIAMRQQLLGLILMVISALVFVGIGIYYILNP